MAEGKAPEPRGLFLRYCWRCNSTAIAVTPKGACAGCGETIDIVDAHALIPELGATIAEPRRREALDACRTHDKPA
jgi:hypothetical protein